LLACAPTLLLSCQRGPHLDSAFTKATLYSLLGRASHATRESILQHLDTDEFLALSTTTRWLYYHPTVLATTIAYYSEIVRRLIMLTENLDYLQGLYH
jgi:hypothetical protein